ncbi:hypothetical protein Bca4012_017175 [Brassica carinata]
MDNKEEQRVKLEEKRVTAYQWLEKETKLLLRKRKLTPLRLVNKYRMDHLLGCNSESFAPEEPVLTPLVPLAENENMVLDLRKYQTIELAHTTTYSRVHKPSTKGRRNGNSDRLINGKPGSNQASMPSCSCSYYFERIKRKVGFSTVMSSSRFQRRHHCLFEW